MIRETPKTKPSVRKTYNSLKGSLRSFDLPSIISKMKLSHSYRKGEINAMVLLNNPSKQIVLTALHEGTVIESFQSNDSITIRIIEGKLKFRARKESLTLVTGQLLTFHEHVNYSLTTKEETVYLLTLANGTLQAAKN